MGVIPQDWSVCSIGELDPFITSGSRGWAKFYADNGSLFVRITNLSREWIYLDLSDVRFVNLPNDEREGTRTQLQAHDVLISITADIGIIAYVSEKIPLPAYINQHIALMRFSPVTVNSQYIAYSLAADASQKRFRALTDQGAKAGMSLITVAKLRVIQPSIEEQNAIAAALSDVDALLEGLEHLIAKKRDLTQAAMRQLLTGQTRLSGFNGPWKVKALGAEIVDLEAGVSVNSIEDEGENVSDHPAILKTSAVANGRFNPSESKTIAPRDLKRVKLNPRAETVIISRMNTLDLVGECGYVPVDFPNLFIPDRLWMTRFKAGSRISAKWLAFVLSAPVARQLLRNIATGTSGSMKNISKGAFLGLEFAFPDPDEQVAIAGVLSDMNEEIAVLERRLAKTRDLKQAMMQELLTGRTRLL